VFVDFQEIGILTVGFGLFYLAIPVHFSYVQFVTAFFSDQKNIPVFQVLIHATYVLNDCININASAKVDGNKLIVKDFRVGGSELRR
jgi:hypothetical protein